MLFPKPWKQETGKSRGINQSDWTQDVNATLNIHYKIKLLKLSD